MDRQQAGRECLGCRKETRAPPLCAPLSLLLGVVQVGMRTPVQAALLQLAVAPVDPAGPHGAVGYVYTLEKGEERRREEDTHSLSLPLSHTHMHIITQSQPTVQLLTLPAAAAAASTLPTPPRAPPPISSQAAVNGASVYISGIMST